MALPGRNRATHDELTGAAERGAESFDLSATTGQRGAWNLNAMWNQTIVFAQASGKVFYRPISPASKDDTTEGSRLFVLSVQEVVSGS
jgi:hypothetical protein